MIGINYHLNTIKRFKLSQVLRDTPYQSNKGNKRMHNQKTLNNIEGQSVPSVTFATRQNDEWKAVTTDTLRAGVTCHGLRQVRIWPNDRNTGDIMGI